jgi:hypothetical protein
MKTKAKAELLAAFDVSPGSIYDRPGVLRSLCEANAEAVGVLAAIEAQSPADTVRATIEALPVDDAARAPGTVTRAKRKKAK